MKAVILAGGLGKRLKPFTEVIPKPLLPIGEKSILEIQISRLKKYGFDDIILCTNYKSEYIKNFLGDGSRYGVTIEVSKELNPLGTAGPLSLLSGKLKEPFIVMNGDILTLLDFGLFYKYALQKDTLLTVAIKKEITPFAFGNIIFEGDYVTNIEEKPNLLFYIMAGIYVMKPNILQHIPKNEYFGVDTLINRFISNNITIAKFEISEYWLDIGKVDDYNEVDNIYEDHFREDIT